MSLEPKGGPGLQSRVSLWDAHSLVGETQMHIIARQWMLLLSGFRQKDTGGGGRGTWGLEFPCRCLHLGGVPSAGPEFLLEEVSWS